MNTPTLNIIEGGFAHCVAEPRGSHGLEGYGLGQSYKFERCEDRKGRYCRVYPDGDFPGYQDDGHDSHKIGSGGKLVMGLMELTGVRKYR